MYFSKLYIVIVKTDFSKRFIKMYNAMHIPFTNDYYFRAFLYFFPRNCKNIADKLYFYNIQLFFVLALKCQKKEK